MGMRGCNLINKTKQGEGGYQLPSVGKKFAAMNRLHQVWIIKVREYPRTSGSGQWGGYDCRAYITCPVLARFEQEAASTTGASRTNYRAFSTQQLTGKNDIVYIHEEVLLLLVCPANDPGFESKQSVGLLRSKGMESFPDPWACNVQLLIQYIFLTVFFIRQSDALPGIFACTS
ncbi:hypothetical protein B0J17DRAFT_703424 [Rhizoctonia solani]|nr:hypothetical protein B0J17DRAFT_703424 [Rhizoctonia solani]